MVEKDGLKLSGIKRLMFKEARDAVVIPPPANLQRNGRQVLGREDARRDAIDIAFDRLRERFLDERRAGGNKLHEPAFDLNVLPMRLT